MYYINKHTLIIMNGYLNLKHALDFFLLIFIKKIQVKYKY